MYGKVFTSIFDSSLVAEGGWLPTYIFMSMITVADKDGIVSIAPKALYRRLGFREYESKVTFEEFQQAITYLENEDEESNSPDHNGRRIVPLSEIPEVDANRGWLVVNYLAYRKKGSREMPGSSTERVRKYRDSKNNGLENGNDNVTTGNGGNGHTDTDTDTDKKEGAKAPLSTLAKIPPCPYTKIVEAFNTEAHESWVTCEPDTLAKSEKANMRARWGWVMGRPIKDDNGKPTKVFYIDEPEKAVGFFQRFFAYAATCESLTRENDIGWSMDLPWLMREKNFLATVRGSKQGRAKQ